MKHVLAASAIAASTLVLCAACAGTSTASGDPGATAAVSTSPSAAGTTAAASTTGASTPTTASGTSSTASGSGSGSNSGSNSNSSSSTCQTRYLNATATNEQGAAGSDYVDIVFKNLNTKACTLYGYPGVSFGAGSPVAQVGQPADRNGAVASTLVTLQPQGSAYAVLQVGDAQNWPASTCKPTATTWLQVIAPNTTNPLYVAFKSTACKGDVVTMHVEAVQPGNGS
jgi:Protein of unknown function (DUF4232)